MANCLSRPMHHLPFQIFLTASCYPHFTGHLILPYELSVNYSLWMCFWVCIWVLSSTPPPHPRWQASQINKPITSDLLITSAPSCPCDPISLPLMTEQSCNCSDQSSQKHPLFLIFLIYLPHPAFSKPEEYTSPIFFYHCQCWRGWPHRRPGNFPWDS